MTDSTADVTVKPFAAFLRETAAGRTHTELSDGLHDLLAAVRETGKGGTLTLTVKVAPLAKNNRDAITTTETVTVKCPSLDRATSVFFIDKDGNPSRDNPQQMTIPTLAEVPRPDVEPVDLPRREAKQ